jgi:Transposase
MSKVTVFVGLDYHKDSVQVCAMDRDGKVLINRSRPNDSNAIAVLVASRVDNVRAAIDVPLDRAETRDGWSGRAEGLLRPESLPRAGTNAWRDRPEPLCVLSPRARRGSRRRGSRRRVD